VAGTEADGSVAPVLEPEPTSEIEVAMLSLSGFSPCAIGEKLSISFETVRAHKKHIYAKLGVGSQSELFAMFYDRGRTGESA